MGFAFNLFMPFRVWSAEPLADLLSKALHRNLTVERVEFEFCAAEDVLGEWRGETRAPEEPATTSDVGVLVRDATNRRGVVLIEVKCGEEHFTPCNGVNSAGNGRKEVCASAPTFLKEPGACYLTHAYRATKDRRYWDIFKKEFGSLAKAFPAVETGGGCPFAGDNQQPMRNHALALGLVQTGKFDFAHFGLVHHDHNPDVPPKWDQYTKLTGNSGMLFSLEAGTILASVTGAGSFEEWCGYVRERYGL